MLRLDLRVPLAPGLPLGRGARLGTGALLEGIEIQKPRDEVVALHLQQIWRASHTLGLTGQPLTPALDARVSRIVPRRLSR